MEWSWELEFGVGIWSLVMSWKKQLYQVIKQVYPDGDDDAESYFLHNIKQTAQVERISPGADLPIPYPLPAGKRTCINTSNI